MSTNMAGCVLRIAYSLLLLASFLQGAENVELFFHKTMEAEVGQNITVPCFVKDATDQKIVSIKWMKNEGTNLAVYDTVYGTYRYWPNVTIQEKRNDANKLIGSHLHLPWVNKWDSGIYICELSKFPSGSFISKTKLTVKDEIKLLCNTDELVEIHIGDNATIQCTVNSNAQYIWTKNNKFVSDNESLELWEVTEAQAGTYSLTVDTGDKSLHKDFIISVLTTTTILRADPTESTEHPTNSLHTSAAISLTTTLSTDTQWTTQPNSSTFGVPASEHVTPPATSTSVSVPSSPDTQTITNFLLNSSMLNNDVTELTSTQRTASDVTKNESRFYRQSTENMFSMSTTESGIAGSTESTGTISTELITSTKTETERSHILLVFIIVLLLLLILVVVILYRKQIMKKRMDLPPPFKPPPPPVKYTAARRSETELYPTSRCNSLSAPTRPIFV
ncbi:T-cell surface protein tactile [Poecilia reticulata]|uniref:T-cell surface protein tactile n=1 Tax=Poecilia reticulata TaxID=8081 RepID=UPI0004A37AD0|nr:PREDICTED: T-cell surface protein tactile-like [Poecilia reticulata]